jgi:hypothetical protein
MLSLAAPLCLAAKPWSGYWWPLSTGELLFGYTSGMSPFEKYDQATYGYSPGPAYSQSYNNGFNYSRRAESWSGLCNGWAAAAIMEPEPTRPINVGSVNFRVGDQKGLLSEAWYRTSGDGWFVGKRYKGYNDGSFEDLYPGQLLDLLNKYVNNGIPIILDFSADEEVWNYPVYSFDLACSGGPRRTNDCRLTVVAANDNVRPDVVGIVKITKTYTFRAETDGNGDVISSSAYWTGYSVSSHPDFAWYPGSRPVLRNSGLKYPLW